MHVEVISIEFSWPFLQKNEAILETSYLSNNVVHVEAISNGFSWSFFADKWKYPRSVLSQMFCELLNDKTLYSRRGSDQTLSDWKREADCKNCRAKHTRETEQ